MSRTDMNSDPNFFVVMKKLPSLDLHLLCTENKTNQTIQPKVSLQKLLWKTRVKSLPAELYLCACSTDACSNLCGTLNSPIQSPNMDISMNISVTSTMAVAKEKKILLCRTHGNVNNSESGTIIAFNEMPSPEILCSSFTVLPQN